MGTFGTGIIQDDTVSDVVGFVVDRLKAGSSLQAASSEALSRFREIEADEDESPLLWLALAFVQWKYGAVVDEAVLQRVRADVLGEHGLDRWRDDPKLLANRKAALSKFLAQIDVPNPKPSSAPRLITRAAPFRVGDCLAVLTSDGRYTAALVLGVDNSNPEYGRNLIAGLDYLESHVPEITVFEQRRWLFKHHGQWNGEPDIAWYLPVGFRKESKRITVVGKVAMWPSDPKDSRSYAGWNLLGQQILYRRSAGARSDV